MQLGRVLLAALVITASFGIARAGVPDGLDRAAISAGIASVKPKVVECGKASPDIKGKVKVKVAVAASGKVSNATVLETPDPALGTCVGAAVKEAKFPETKNGGTFSYPFVF